MTLKSLGLLLLLIACGNAAIADEMYYTTAYRAQIRPESGTIDMELNLSGEHLPSRIVLRADPKRYKNFTSTDPLQIGESHITWRPRGKMSRLRYQFVVNHERAPKRYDSLITDTWTIFRGDKLVPRAKVTARRGLRSRASLEFVTPPDWSVITPYAPASGRPYVFDDPQRRFDRPAGWMLAGKIGSRGERIGDVHVVVAAPAGDSSRRQDMLAFLNWNLPRLQQVFQQFPKRLLIVTAGDPMWRGGLSGPASMFLHADRPLISENRTSSLLHELSHIAMGIRGDEESDWIVEGLAEFYSLETLRRSGSISERRHEQAVASLENWARRAPTLFGNRSSGPTTARAVLTFRNVDAEIRKLTHDKASLDDLARKLAAERGTVNLARLQKTAQEIAGRPLQSLTREQLATPISAPAR
jgi:predicted metalloprotease with PDZ domain